MIARSSFLFTFGTLISRITGLIRDMIILAVFGAGSLLDAFFVAFMIPNLFREMLAEGALGSSFTKVFSFLWEKDQEEAKKLFVDSLYFLTLASVLLCILGVIGAPYLVYINTFFVSKSASGDFFLQTTTGLTRLLFPYLLLSILSAIAMGALNQRGRFFLSAIAPVAGNVGFIVGALVLSNLFASSGFLWIEHLFAEPRITGLAVGVLLGGLLQIFIELWGLWKPILKKGLYLPTRIPWSPHLKEILFLMFPMAIAASAGQINIIVNTNFATSLEPGSVTWLRSSFRLLQLPIGLFGVAIASVVLPTLAKSMYAAGKKVDAKVSSELQGAIELVLWLMIPSLVFLACNATPIIRILYEHGQFQLHDTEQTAKALFAYSFGLIGYGLIKVLLPFYYAVERTKYAMRVSLAIILINFFGNYILVKMANLGHQGLAFTSSISLTFNAFCLILGLRHESLVFEWKSISRSILFLLLGTLFAFGTHQLFNLSLVEMFPKSWTLKQQSITSVLLEGITIFILFAGFGLMRLQLSPVKALRLLTKREKKTP